MLEYVERVVSSSTMDELWQMHCDVMASYGFTRLLYGMAASRSRASLGARDDFLILTNIGGGYMDTFINDGLYMHAPMVRWARENAGACSWGWIAENADALTPQEREVVAFNSKHDITAGYSISFVEIGARNIAAIGLIPDPGVSQARTDAIWEEHGRELIAMNNVLHLKILTLPYPNTRKALTKRQREALEWVGEGKTTQDIGVIMGLTPATVEKHLRLAREALDVETTAQAVLKASLQNQIFRIEG
ncbi:LuxR family transcriptional regulator [Psychromarinibacter sp. C21-152]|uniref:LuxR family transcriptional regulator n=2 Tax=Psychromarinibacter sediminicola TaxID=3033385 RepID=A0AAE3T9G2_9RHOB|nr:LuxR family transcriptional regulator [Psychromarinibacter sediminicola]